MEIIKMYAVWDKKAERYDTPWFQLEDVHASRRFIMLCQEEGTQFSKFKNDYVLYRIAEFNVCTGDINVQKVRINDGIQIEKGENK